MSEAEARILIVRHGEHRGRGRAHYLWRSLTHLKRRRPDLFRRLVFHHTGGPAPNLDGIAAVVFWLWSPLREHHPACYQEAVRIAEEATNKSIPVINPPWAISDLGKSRQGRLWREAGIPTPEVETFETLDSLKAAAGRLVFPLVLRRDLAHFQKAMRIVRDPGELLKLDSAPRLFPSAVSPYIDVRAGYRGTAPKSAYARLFHKKRLIVANGIVRTKHVMFSANPIVGGKTSLFKKAERFGRLEALFLLRPLHRECVEHDLSYWQQEEEHRALMLKACEVVGVQFAAIDYSNLSDGTPILWEVNPYFALSSPILLPRRRRAPERHASYHETIGKFLGVLLTAPNGTGAACVA